MIASKQIQDFALWSFLAASIALLSGASCAFFLWALAFCSDLHRQQPWLLYLLPAAGLATTAAYRFWGREVAGGNKLILQQWREPTKPISWRMAPLILFSTLTSHLFGASVGREGSAVQMGASLAEQLRFFAPDTRPRLLAMGMAGGFAALFGTPLAAALFANEIVRRGRIISRDLPSCLATAFAADAVCLFLGGQHSHYAFAAAEAWHYTSVAAALLIGLAAGLGAGFFVRALGYWKGLLGLATSSDYGRIVLGALLFIGAIELLDDGQVFLGLGLEHIEASFLGPLPSSDFLIKLLLTTLCLAAGFKGGEVTPLFFIGACLGNALAPHLGLDCSFAAGLGFVAFFSGATKAPLASTALALELFGGEGLHFFLLACFAASLSSGAKSIYD